jgi:hypothetical protein
MMDSRAMSTYIFWSSFGADFPCSTFTGFLFFGGGGCFAAFFDFFVAFPFVPAIVLPDR